LWDSFAFISRAIGSNIHNARLAKVPHVSREITGIFETQFGVIPQITITITGI
jgi:hypothetical protein